MKINIIFALENTCNVLCNSIIRGWKIMRYTRFIIMGPRFNPGSRYHRIAVGWLPRLAVFLKEMMAG